MVREHRVFFTGTCAYLLPSLATVALLAVAMPGRFGWWPLLFVALIPLLYTVYNQAPGRALRAGLLAGFVYYICLLYWIVIVLGRYGGLPLGLTVPALLLLSLYMGLYTGVFAALLSFTVHHRGGVETSAAAIFAAPFLWVAMDWLRGFLLSGFPWMDMGYGLYTVPLLIQAADLGGHHVLTFLLVMVNCLVLHGAIVLRTGQSGVVKYWLIPVAAVGILLLASAYSVYRSAHVQGLVVDAERIRVAVVQGNIPQDEKWTPERKQSTLDTYERLTSQAVAEKDPALVVWPETALPFYPENDPLFERVSRLARKNEIWLLTGAPHFKFIPGQPGISKHTIEYFNSALLMSPEGEVRARYDKQHLVPFGEYVPLENFLTFLAPLVESVGNFMSGRSGAPLPAGKVRAGTLICYESIFPELARQTVDQGADFLVNLTNDAWYGRSSAPFQSFAMSVLRSVETRRSQVRAANTGISGFVDPHGLIMASSSLFEPVIMAEEIPLLETQTVFVRFGYLFAPGCLLLSILLVLFRRKRN